MENDPNNKLQGPVKKGLLIFGNTAKDPLPLYGLLGYTGTMQAIMAAAILEKDPDQGDLTKVVYPETGRYFGISAEAVEHNIQRFIDGLWPKNRQALCCFLGGVQEEAPTVAEFVQYLARLSKENSNRERLPLGGISAREKGLISDLTEHKISKEEGQMKKLSGPVNKALLIFGNTANDPLPLYSILSYKGAMQAVVAAMILDEDPEQEYMFTKVVYPGAGKYFGVSGETVERNIRIFVNALWGKKRPEFFRFLVGVPAKAPTVAEFVTFLMLQLRQAEEKVITEEVLAGLPLIQEAGVVTEALRKVCDDRDEVVQARIEEALQQQAKREKHCKAVAHQFDLYDADYTPDGSL